VVEALLLIALAVPPWADSPRQIVQDRPEARVATGLHSSIKVTERHYSPWVRARQEQLEADVRRTWERCLPDMKGADAVQQERGADNYLNGYRIPSPEELCHEVPSLLG
jgi:hypothetical protein